VLGYPPRETVDRSAIELVDPRFRARAAAVLRRVAATHGAREEIEVPVVRADGDWRWLSVTATNRTDDPIVDGIVLNYRDITERRELEQRLERQAFTDALTGLPNRPLFIDRLEHVLARRRRAGVGHSPVSVLFLDIDDFKSVNDSMGHGAGDQLLVGVADRLRAALRPADTAARFGGDEFAILIENSTEADARRVADRILGTLAEPMRIDDTDVRATVSIGIAVDDKDARHASADELLRDADLAMYSAKSAEPGTFTVYEPGMLAAAVERMERTDRPRARRPDGRQKRATTWEPTKRSDLEAPRPAPA